MYLVYTAPPSNRCWGLVRDTRRSIIDPGRWPSVDEAVLYYYLIDFEENQPSSSFRQPDEPDIIRWFGFSHEHRPERLSDIPQGNRYTPPSEPSSVKFDHVSPELGEPRLYQDPS